MINHELTESINLSRVMNKVKKETGWSDDQLLIIEKFYKNFLYLCCKYKNISIIPTKVIDIVWHHHLMDTKQYLYDCENTFGRFIHHNPYLGFGGKEDEQLLTNNFSITNNLFKKEFGYGYEKLFSLFGDQEFVGCGSGGCGLDNC